MPEPRRTARPTAVQTHRRTTQAASSTSGFFTGWNGQERVQWACTLLEQLGETTLETLPLLLSGMRVTERTVQAQGHETALRNLRRRTGHLLTPRAVRVAVKAFLRAVDNGTAEASFRIHPGDLSFTRIPGHEARIEEARTMLHAPPDRPRQSLSVAPLGDLTARLRHRTDPIDIPLRLTDLDLELPKQHDLERTPTRNLTVTVAELEATADRLDLLDQAPEATWDREHWRSRLDKVISLQRVTPGGLAHTDTLDLTGLQHLIGLPGAGKTTLITLLCATLAARGQRVSVFFTSIEVAREYLDRLRNYNVGAAMLVGRSESTHRKHGERLAELIAAEGNGGFGHTMGAADLFAQTCPLPAFAVNENDAWARWAPEDAPPCEHIYRQTEKGNTVQHLCPVWSRCGRMKNHRELVTASVWLGHVRSADTPVPAHTTPERLQYFELIARTFDLVIFDEVDETQKKLDELGANSLKLGGSPDSIHAEAQKVTTRALNGNPAVTDRRMYTHAHAANNFERHLIRLHEEISTFEDRHQEDLSLALENRLLTTNFLIRVALKHFKIHASSDRRSGIYAFFDGALYAAYNPDRPPPCPAVEDALGLTREELQQRWTALVGALGLYWTQMQRTDDIEDEMDAVAVQFALLLAPEHQAVLAPIARLAVAVGFSIAAYQELVRATRALAGHDILQQAVRAKASADLDLMVPRNLLGTFSSVLYRRKAEGIGFDIEYLVLDSTPRMLLQRLHEEGTNVLLTSATSWLPDASAYHVNVPPSYVLRPKAQDNTRITLKFRPVTDPQRNEPVRISGTGVHMNANLRTVVRDLARPDQGGGLSKLELSIRASRTANGRTRKAALIVNSYDQVTEVIREIARVNPKLAERARGVQRAKPDAAPPGERYVLRGQVESLGHQDDVDVIVFPVTALGRGVNIVFHTDDKDDTDNGVAAIGTLYFLIRPHPVVGDLTLMLSRIARDTEAFDQSSAAGQTLEALSAAQRRARGELFGSVMRLLARPMSASMLPSEFVRPFAANLLIPVVQTIGRAIRRSQPAEVHFVDAAWAPKSAAGQTDDERSSVLVGMQHLLRSLVGSTDPGQRDIFQALYGPFADAFADIDGLGPGGGLAPEDDEDDRYLSGFDDEG
ncbi:hypothetical protein [Deinococcus sonorensis]|uniref:pPIWI-RE three-gene island domain-containing protein n=2 Tax=Deinococcus sonorensis TaxID=309891 RepID=A0AAU7UG51_9DEIO